jgi:hypothetical protein
MARFGYRLTPGGREDSPTGSGLVTLPPRFAVELSQTEAPDWGGTVLACPRKRPPASSLVWSGAASNTPQSTRATGAREPRQGQTWRTARNGSGPTAA